MAVNKLQAIVDAFQKFADQQGWEIAEEKAIQSGCQLTVTHENIRVPVCFFQSGKMLVQGKPSILQTTIKSWVYDSPPNATMWSSIDVQPVREVLDKQVQVQHTSQTMGIARIGSDESGKGDYFGPLVVAAVYVDEESESQLVALGVRDSKLLPDTLIYSLAEEIKKICKGKGIYRLYPPQRYNELYALTPNLNLLLAVAAASIVARAGFVQAIQKLSTSLGIPLPKGASDPKIITVGREIVAQKGQETLQKIAKWHFKTTEIILHKEL